MGGWMDRQIKEHGCAVAWEMGSKQVDEQTDGQREREREREREIYVRALTSTLGV